MLLMVRAILKEVCKGLERGEEVKWTADNQSLTWTWTNTTTQLQYSVNIRHFKRLMDQSKKDPRLPHILAFITNHIKAHEAWEAIQRLEKLKAFW
jgi:hypothetical protein